MHVRSGFPRPRLRAALLAGAAVLALAAPAARADIEIEVGNGDRVTGSFLPADEVETFTARIPAGAKLTIVAKGKKKKGAPTPVLDATVLDPFGEEVAQDETVDLPTGEKVANYEVTDTGPHTIRVTSSAAGDYTLAVKWRIPPVVTEVLSMGGLGDEQTVAFAADVGSVVSVTASRAKGSDALPRIFSIDEAEFEWSSDFFEPPANPNAPSHSVKKVRIGGPGGEYLVLVGDDSEFGGDVKVVVSVAPPRAKARKIDVSTKQTGADPSNQYGKGAVIGPDGGDLVLDTGDSILNGSGISIPEGAMTTPTVILISTDGPITPPGDGLQPSGPGVAFGPDGLQFKASTTGDDVLVTIPFDPADFDGDFSLLDVYVKDSKGKVSLVIPKSSYQIDPDAGTVTFPVSHFSTYQTFGPRRARPADLNGDGFDDLVVPASAANGGRGRVHIVFGRRDIASAPPRSFSRTIEGPVSGMGFGRSVAVGDLNGDGIADLAVGSVDPQNFDGSVSVWLGGAGIGLPADTADAVISAVGTAADFGYALGIADVTGDGKRDLVAGAPALEGQVLTTDGAVFIFPGATTFTFQSIGDAGVIRLDGDIEEQLGTAFAFGSLVGEDTHVDLVVSGAGGPAGPASGTVRVIEGGPNLSSGPAADKGIDFSGDLDGDRFGESVGVGDVNGDGLLDLVAGAPGADVIDDTESLIERSGTVYIFLGPGIDGGGAALADYEIDAFPQMDQARGDAVAVGQFIGNSTADIAFGTPHRDADSGTPVDIGSVGLLKGTEDFPESLTLVGGSEANQRLGARFLPVADLNGDGRLDLAVASPGFASGAGRITVSMGNGLFAVTFTLTGAAGEGIGR